MLLQIKRSLILKSWIVIVITALLMTSLTIPTSTFASASALEPNSHQRSEPYTIVALGDSITAGYEPDRITGVDSYGFVERVEEQGWFYSETEAINLGLVGLTSEGLLKYVTALQVGESVTADSIQAHIEDDHIHELAKEISTAKQNVMKADVITITIGGNDLIQVVAGLKLSNAAQFKRDVNHAIAAYKHNLQETVELIYAINPNVKIVVADQYQPIPKKAVGSLYTFLQESMNRFTQSTDAVAGEFRRSGKQVQVVHLAELFRGKESQYTHIESNLDIHPNQAGYELIAKAISALIWDDYIHTAGSLGQSTLSIVFRGHELKINPSLSPLFTYGAVYMPVSELVNGLGGSVGWKNTTKSISIQFEGKTLLQAVTMLEHFNSSYEEPEALLIRGKSYISLKWITEQLGLKMKYSEHMKTVFLF